MNVKDFAERYWWPLKEAKLAPSTLSGYRSDYMNLVLPRWGETELDDVDPMDIETWIAPMSYGKAVNALGALRRIMRRAEGKGLIAIDPTRRDIELPIKHYRYRAPALDSDEVVRLLRGFWGHELEPIVTISVLCGLRRCEVCALYWSDIDLREGIVKVNKGYQCVGGELVEWFCKTEKSVREVAIPPTSVRRLREIRGKGPLVPDDGHRMNPDKVARRYKAWCGKQDLPYVSMTNLRHTFARMTIATGEISDVVARDLMGHSEHSEMLEKNYYSSNRTIAKAAARSIERLLLE